MNTQDTEARELAKAEYEQEIQDKAKEIANLISKTVNRIGNNQLAAAIGKEMTNDHRTLIQGKMPMILAFIKEMSDNFQNGHFDARNAKTAEVCHKMYSALSIDDTYLPFI